MNKKLKNVLNITLFASLIGGGLIACQTVPSSVNSSSQTTTSSQGTSNSQTSSSSQTSSNSQTSSATSEDNEYTISFYADEVLVDEIFTSGNEAITLPEAPKKDNFTFEGWFLDKDVWSNELLSDTYLNQPLLNDINAYAYYLPIEEPSPTEYSISFYLDEELFYSLKTAGNEIISLPVAPNKEDYTFKGWYFDKGTYLNKLEENTYENTSLISDVNVYGYYEQNEPDIEEFTVTFECNDGTPVETMVTSLIEEEPITVRDGYTFDGWYKESEFINKVTFPYEVKENQTLFAKWVLNKVDVSFVVSSEGVLTEVNGINENNKVIEIPSTVNGIQVLAIGDQVFTNNTYVEKIVFPDSVTTLGYKMCYGCSNLKEVVLPDSVTVIPDYSFEKCGQLTQVNMPKSLVQIRYNAFAESGIEEFIAPQSLKEIWGYAFQSCSKLKNVALASINSIGDSAFENCSSLEEINLPDSLKELGTYVFSGCEILNKIRMPQNPINISNNALYGTGYYNDSSNWENGILYADGYLLCSSDDLSSFQEVNVKEGTIVIASNAFSKGAKNINKITLPEGLLQIGTTAFSSLYSLDEINIPSSVRSIGYNAFASTKIASNKENWNDNGVYIDNWLVLVDSIKLDSFTVKEGTIGIADGKDTSLFPTKAQAAKSLILPESLKYIGVRSFARLKITELQLPQGLESIGEGAFKSCGFLTNVNLGDCSKLKTIGELAFSECAIEEITIPSSVETVGELVFNNNTKDLLIHCQVSEKPSAWDNDWSYTYSSKAKITVEWKK